MTSKADYEHFFKEADTDNSGYLDYKELITILRKHGYSKTDNEILNEFKRVDTSGDGKISMDEYMEAMGQISEKTHGEASMRSVFRSFDKDGSGQITKGELKEVFKKMGRYFQDAELERMISMADIDGDGMLSYEEFIKYCFGK